MLSLANFALDIEQHEAMADIDEDEYIQRIETMRADTAKGNRIAEVSQACTEESVAEHERRQQEHAGKEDTAS